VAKVTLLCYLLAVSLHGSHVQLDLFTPPLDPQERLEAAKAAKREAQHAAMHADPVAWEAYSRATAAYERTRKDGTITQEIRQARATAELAAKQADPVKYQALLVASREFNNAKYALEPWYDKSDKARAVEREKERAMRADPDKVAKYRKRKREYIKARRVRDEQYRVRERLRARLRGVVAGTTTTRSKTYGIDWQAILDHLGPCPGDPAGYHVDHIIPLSSFDLTDPAQVKAAFAPTNHQWLTTAENLAKSDKLTAKT
jgi:hypothetical protein